MFFGKEKREMLETMKGIVNNTQENNLMLADALRSITGEKGALISKYEKKRYTEDEKWKAAYALNLCIVSISQIIEYNDLRFMDQEYENILNNLNLEMMPKDEALLDVLKQILDVITFFRIQSEERKMLDKEYQQKMKDAIWSAAPSPSVIMSGGSGGWIGLAVTAAISVGTGYMNYRKEKAKIGLEQERKEWELERSLMEQLNGLRRQLFETSWRLADEYQFSDALRLTERQIKQFNEMLQDDDPLRQYYRLEYLQSQYEAYPPFWYYLGSAALKVADKFKNDGEICEQYLKKASTHFDYFFEKSAFKNKLLREDPVVAQCAFEYIATLEMQENMGVLPISKKEKSKLIGEKLDLAVKSSGNALDVLQMCALHYLSANRDDEAMAVLRMLVNEFYNVSSNAQLLSMLYVKAAVAGNQEAKVSYDLLTKTCPYKIELYRMPESKNNVNFAYLDDDFCKRQRTYLANRYLDVLESYLGREEKIFNSIWGKDYDISEEIVGFFNGFAKAMSILLPEKGETFVKEGLNDALGEIKQTEGRSEIFSEISARVNYKFASFVNTSVSDIAKGIFDQLRYAASYKELSDMEIRLIDFCNKYSLVNEKNLVINHNNENEQSVESILTGKSLAQSKIEKQEFEDCMNVIKDANLNGGIVTPDSKKDGEVECYYSDSRQYEKYYSERIALIKSLDGRVLAVIEDKKGMSKNDLVFTTKKIYILIKHWYDDFWYIEHDVSYGEINISKKNNALEDNLGNKIYAEAPKEIDYSALGDMLHNLKKVAEKYGTHENECDSCKAIMHNIKKECFNLLRGIVNSSSPQAYLPGADNYSSRNSAIAIVTRVTQIENGISAHVEIQKGSFSPGDKVGILRSDGESNHYDSIARIYANEEFPKEISQGNTAVFFFENTKRDCIDIDSEIKLLRKK